MKMVTSSMDTPIAKRTTTSKRTDPPTNHSKISPPDEPSHFCSTPANAFTLEWGSVGGSRLATPRGTLGRFIIHLRRRWGFTSEASLKLTDRPCSD